jgi:hypothetical protein
MTISSLKTSPKVVSNSVNQPSPGSASEDQSEGELEIQEDEEEGSPAKSEDEIKTDNEKGTEEEEGENEKEDEDEESAKDNKETPEEEEKDVPAFQGILASALGLKRVTRRSTSLLDESKKGEKETAVLRKSVGRPSGTKTEAEPLKAGKVEEEEDKLTEDEEETSAEETTTKPKQSKAQDFMDQISNQAQTKPGYRFNISKDISISAIGDEGESGGNESKMRGIPATNKGGTPNPNLHRFVQGMRPGLRKSTGAGLPSMIPRQGTPGGMRPGAGKPSMQMQMQQMTSGLSPRLRPSVVPSGASSGQRYIMNKDGSVRPMLKATRTIPGINNRGTT